MHGRGQEKVLTNSSKPIADPYDKYGIVEFEPAFPPVITPVNTRAEAAKMAGVSEDTYRKGKAVLQSDDEETKEAYRAREQHLPTRPEKPTAQDGRYGVSAPALV